MRQRFRNLALTWFGLLSACLGLLAACAPALAPGGGAGVAEAGALESRLAEVVDDLRPRTPNYDQPDGPLYTGAHAPASPATPPDDLVVVAYNLRYAEAIEQAIEALQAVPPLPEADFLLLQEMDAAGVDALATALGYDYVYYPASVAEDGDDFGNAILSRWPLVEPAKIILPGLHPLTGQQRIATRAVARVGGRDVVLYSVHIETATAPPALREEQMAAVLADVPPDAEAVIIGGDFNTVTDQGVATLGEQFAAGEVALLTDGLGPTLMRFDRPIAPADHILGRGFKLVDAGVLRDVTASDHFPVWVRLR